MPTPNEILIHLKEHSLMKPEAKIASIDLNECYRSANDIGEGTPEDHPQTNSWQHRFVLSFNHLTYSVKSHRHHWTCPVFRCRKSGSEHKVLLDNASGEAKQGEILAVLGPSGSGKSTLIDALADRISNKSLKGTTTLNDQLLQSKLLTSISAYVMQDDLLFPMLTVEETLMFAAEFRLPRSLSKARKRSRVLALIKQLGLQDASATMIGDEGHRGVSGGERRRVSIGIDIIHDPILLFLDEPTSGLDSTSSLMVVKVLKRIALSGSSVIMSIHQPSSRILTLLDKVIFLSRGQTVYSGTPDHLPKFFAEFGHPIPESENRSEFVLDLILQFEESPNGAQRLVDFNKLWRNQMTNKQTLKQAIRISKPRYANPIWVEMYVIAKRSILNSIRAPEQFGIRFLIVVITGVILATVFWRPDVTPRGAQERVSFFILAISTTFYASAEALPRMVEQKSIFEKETAYQAYRRTSYVLSHTLTSIPSLALLAFAFASITFWGVGLAGGGAGFVSYSLFVFAAFWAGDSFVTFVSGVVKSVMFGYAAVVAMMANFVLFSGFFIGRDRMKGYWIWYHYATMVKYPYEGVMQGEFEGGRCFGRGWEMFDTTPFEGVAEELKGEVMEMINGALGGRREITERSCVLTGMEVLRRQGVDDVSMWTCFWITIAFGVLFRVLFYSALMFGTNIKRK